MLTTEELKLALNEQLADKVAEDIVAVMDSHATPQNLEVDFHISSGKMVESLDSPNTWFCVDCPEKTSLWKAKEIISEVFGQSFDHNNTEEFRAMEERKAICDNFREMLRVILNSGLFNERVSNTLRRIALGNVPRQLVPIEVIRFLSIDLGEASNDDYLLTVHKIAKIDPISGRFLTPPQSVNEDLFSTHRDTGMPFEDIVKMRKESGDPRYELVAGVDAKRYSFELHCTMSADYSFCEPPNALKPLGD